MPNWSTKTLQVMIALALPITLLIGNVQLLAHMRFVRYEYNKPDFPKDTAIPTGGYELSKAERTSLAKAALQSIIGSQGMRALEEARFQETGAPAFNAREIRHMRDVRQIFRWSQRLFWLALVVLVGGGALLAWRDQERHKVAQPLLTSVVVTLSLAAVLGLYVLLNFGSFFTQFHHLFFEGNSWLFRRDDTLIRLFPTQFWFDASILIAGSTALELLLVGVGVWLWDKRGGQGEDTPRKV